MDLRTGLLFFIILVCSLCIHEWAHAWVADKLGDPTPHSQGRVTLNPLPHIDPIGTIVFPLVCIFLLEGSFFLGWARPVMVNSSHFKHPGRGDLLTTFAGPLSNFLLTIVAALGGAISVRLLPETKDLVFGVVSINAWLFVFNMLPIPPLDGGRILRHFVNMSWETFAQISRWSMLGIIVAFQLIPAFRALFGFLIGLTAAPAMILYSLLAGR